MNRIYQKTLIMAVMFVLVLVGCTDDDGGGNTFSDECTKIEHVNVDEQTTKLLDSLFSNANAILGENKKDSVCYLITNEKDLQAINPFDFEINIDFSKYTLVACKIYTESSSNKISKAELCASPTKYVYETTVWHPIDSYPGFDNIYCWNIFPKINDKYDIELKINNIFESK